jgi:hypothetical protein
MITTKLDLQDNLAKPEAGKRPEKVLVESAYATFGTLRRGIPNTFSGLFPASGVHKKLRSSLDNYERDIA